MSTLWTPGGERPVPPPRRDPESTPDPQEGEEPTPEELEARLGEIREELARTPASAVIVNHCLAFFELAALHLSLQPPQLSEAQLAIDAMAALIDGLAGRLGEDEGQLQAALSQLRLAFVEVRAANLGDRPPPPE